MGLAAPVRPSPSAPPPPPGPRTRRAPELRLEGRLLDNPTPLLAARSATLSISLLVHGVIVAAAIVVPLLHYAELVDVQQEAVHAFFSMPEQMLPPPPPPPAPAARRVTEPRPAPRAEAPASFVAPIEIPEEIVADEGLDLGVEGGIPGGVEGGVPGGVVGGIVGGLPTEAPPPVPVVRVGGMLKPPRLLQRVAPEYPELAKIARAQGIVIIEAHVGMDGRVRSARILRGMPLLDEPALAAVKQWRYAPLLLNGVPTEFLLTVTVSFTLAAAPGSA